MISIVIFFLALSLLLYVLLGGADFGAGILELFSSRDKRALHEELVNKALAPVWEANHIWLIIAVVILFTGFPEAYAKLSIYFHVPLTLMLFGIVLRGCSFVFRHYAVPQDGGHKIFSNIFKASSFLTPLMFGVIIGAMLSGRIPEEPAGYVKTYVAPWANAFSFSVGIFVALLFTLTASVYMIGESYGKIWQKYFISKAKVFQVLTVVWGSVVFLVSEYDGPHLIRRYLAHTPSFVCLVLATITLPILWMYFNRGYVWTTRALVGIEITLIMSGWFFQTFPTIIFSEANPVTFFNAAAPDATLNVLGWALMIGSVIFLPLLVYLYKVFKYQGTEHR